MRELELTTSTDQVEYGMNAMDDIARVRLGQKPLLIMDQRKCPPAYQAMLDIVAESPELYCIRTQLVSDNGDLSDHAFICAMGAPYAHEALQAVFDAIADGAQANTDAERAKIRRKAQIHIGLLLGYSGYECIEFADSELGKTCECDCCGSPFTLAKGYDTNPSRFLPNAYVY